ncbi:MAG TPA: TIGR03000 domain-containing protein, partial [Gemmataceae bacterium]|nr:TIGR03000 domain-containing protein [Gemmataceae bacterium]
YYNYGYSSPGYYDYGQNSYTQSSSVYVQPMDYANIRVIVPDANAQVWFDGTLTKQTGTDRLFSTPTLTNGSTGTYRVRASWMQNGKETIQERAVTVSPGQTYIVDFNQSGVSSAPQ